MIANLSYFTFYRNSVLSISFILVLSLNTYSQSNISYKELTPLLGLIKNHICSNLDGFYANEEPLLQGVLALKWDLDNSETFENLYQQIKDTNIDYRYPFLIAKIAKDNFRKNNFDNTAEERLIEYYYKSLFLNLAIEKNTNRYNPFKDSLKYQYTRQYILSTIEDSCFPSYKEFENFALLNIKYSNELLKGFRFKLSKSERSELYYIIGDAIYRTRDVEDSDKESLIEVFKYLSLAINEDPNNWRALSTRAHLKKTILLNYSSAIKDYKFLINLKETQNKENIAYHNKWLTRQNSTNKKTFGIVSPTFEYMMDIVDCYLNLNDDSNVLVWLNNATNSIKLYREYNVNSELASSYEGMIYYFKAVANFNLNNKSQACNDIEAAINTGYDLDDCKKLQLELNCGQNKNTINIVNSVPMTKTGGVYEIPVVINGVLKLNFIFDAGASDVSISSDVALTLIRTGTVSEKDFIGTETYKFADGSTAKSKVFLIKEIQIGNKTVKNIRASISKSLNAPLLLGQSFLNKFGKVSIDYIKNVIVFED